MYLKRAYTLSVCIIFYHLPIPYYYILSFNHNLFVYILTFSPSLPLSLILFLVHINTNSVFFH
ncbi:hypothetical protein K501DRAFT_220385, partial [Backusella circina FSU 941]